MHVEASSIFLTPAVDSLWLPSAGVIAEIKKRAKRQYNSNHDDLRGGKAIFVVRVWEIREHQSVLDTGEMIEYV